MNISSNFSANFIAPVKNSLKNSVNFKGIDDIPRDTFEGSESIFATKNVKKVLQNPENIIGHGSSHNVYEIPGNDKYVLRVSKKYFDPNFDKSTYIAEDGSYEDFNIGQRVGVIKTQRDNKTLFGQEIEVLKKQHGESYGVPHYSALMNEYGEMYEGEDYYDAPSRKASFKALLDTVSKFDVETFEVMLDIFNRAQNAGYSFDPLNTHNFLIEDDGINMIDFDKSSVKCTYIELLNALVNHEYMQSYMNDVQFVSDSDKKEAYDESVQIISKFVQAMLNKGLKFDYEYLKHGEALDILRAPDFREAVGYNPQSGLTIKQHLVEIGLADKILL